MPESHGRTIIVKETEVALLGPGALTNGNMALKHYMNVTWVSRPITEGKRSEGELFGKFYDREILV